MTDKPAPKPRAYSHAKRALVRLGKLPLDSDASMDELMALLEQEAPDTFRELRAMMGEVEK